MPPEISIKAEELFHIGPLPVTNALFLAFLTLLIFLGIALFIHRRMSLIPGKFQSVFELLFEQILKLMDTTLGTRERSLKYFPLVATVFLFILASNWLGLFPFVGSILFSHDGHDLPLFRAPTSDLNLTIALALIAVFSTHFLAVLAIGFKKHASKFFTLKSPIFSFVGILEFVSEFVKIISFSFRLFGNVFAGEVLLVIVGFLIPYVIPLPFLFLEVFVGFIQAFVFAMLTLVFLSMNMQEGEAH